jgi:hypothetical protein
MTPVEREYDLYSHDAKVNAHKIALSPLLRRLEALPVAWDRAPAD